MSTIQKARVAPGDLVEVSGRRVGDRARSGEILEVLGSSERPHYLVRGQDGHESVLYPGEATTIRRKAPRAKPEVGLEPTAARLQIGCSTS